MHVLVVGAAGQVGFELLRAEWPSEVRLTGVSRHELDLEDRAAIDGLLRDVAPDLIVNAAAYTAVDKAEGDPMRAFAVNRDAVGQMAETCRQLGVPLIHLSTDYVFDGSQPTPYRETDPVAPLGVYGRSKEAGEAVLRDTLPAHVILRTAWVYGVHGHNFVKTMLRLGAERDELRVVADQQGCPTFARDIARAIVTIAQATADGQEAWGTYHFSGAGRTNWHGFAEKIFELSAPATGKRPLVQAIRTVDYPTPASRPANSVLDCSRVASAFGVVAPAWERSLQIMLADYLDIVTKKPPAEVAGS
jgi:dTDP-4-dehydrorhamnose reductase